MTDPTALQNSWIRMAKAVRDRLNGQFVGGAKLRNSRRPRAGGTSQVQLPYAVIDVLGMSPQGNEDPEGFYTDDLQLQVLLTLPRKETDPLDDAEIECYWMTIFHRALHSGPNGRDLEEPGFQDLEIISADMLGDVTDEELEVDIRIRVQHTFPVADPSASLTTLS